MSYISNLKEICVVALLASLVYYGARTFQRWLAERGLDPLPPVAKGHVLIGNLLEIIAASKKGEQHLLFEKMAKEHGEIVCVKAGPMTQYFINSDRAVKDILDRQSAVTSERPRWIVASEQMSNNFNILLINSSTQTWKRQRRVTHNVATSIPRADAGLSYLHFESANFLHSLVMDPSICASNTAIWRHVKRYTYSTFTSQIIGMDVADPDSPEIPFIEHTGLQFILATLPGSYIVDFLPILDRLPLWLKPWERMARAKYAVDRDWALDRARRIEEGATRYAHVDAFLPRAIKDEKILGLTSLEEASYHSLSLVIGAADTSAISTWAFLEAMLTYPKVQAKAATMITAAVPDRLPTYEDLDKIPYVRCIMKETWRWRPPVALGHPHISTQDINYQGMRIPKGSKLHLNAWAIHHDPNRYTDPDEFVPERFTDDLRTTMESANSADAANRDHFAFGAGRRICPGMHVADRSLAVAVMRILWAFEVKTREGALLDPSLYRAQMPGQASPDLPVMFVLRTEEKARIIKMEYARLVEERVPLVSFCFRLVWYEANSIEEPL